jgi:hypothetical protein
MDTLTAVRVLKEKGITANEMEDISLKLFRCIAEDVDKTDLDGNHKSLFHLVLTYFIFNGAIMAYDEGIKEAAAEHNMKPEKYIKIMFNL